MGNLWPGVFMLVVGLAFVFGRKRVARFGGLRPGRGGERLDKLREYAFLLVGVGWAAVGVLVLLGVVRLA